MTENDTSGYSSTRTTPQSSTEDLGKSQILHRKCRRLTSLRLDTESDSGLSEEEDDCEFRPIVTENETEPHKEWYNKLIKLRCEHPGGSKYVFPPFPPPPLPSAMLAASRATTVNPFDVVKRAAVKNLTDSPSTSSPNTINRFNPIDFRALPPPHVFLGMIRTLAPHQYVDLTYALAGAVLLDIGAKVPDHYPPIPPKIDPYRRMDEDECISRQETEMSSQSSSGGEYSDDDEETRRDSKMKRESNHRRRAERAVRITARQSFREQYQEFAPEIETERFETFSRDQNYKLKTLSTFIPPQFGHRKHLAPPQFCPPFPFPFPMDLPMLPDQQDPPIPPPIGPFMPIMMIPFPVPPILPGNSSILPPNSPKNRLNLKISSEKERKQPEKIILSKNESAMASSLMRWRGSVGKSII